MRELRVSTFDMVLCLSRAIDLVSPSLVNHHHRVAYVAHSLASEMKLPLPARSDLLLAGALHDVGALSLPKRLPALAFDEDQDAMDAHARTGSRIVSGFAPFSRAASLIRHHHRRWDRTQQEVPLDSHILHLADRVAVLIPGRVPTLAEVTDILARVQKEVGKMFAPELVDVFCKLAERESFWLDIASPSLDSILEEAAHLGTVEMDIHQILNLSLLFSKIIDFQSPFTSTHSRGVAALAEALTELFSFSAREALLMRAAGYLHDLGKLAVPPSILDKSGKLDPEEWAVVRTHTYHTYHILSTVDALKPMAEWAGFHHERLDGHGYPFHLDEEELPLRSRIMAVADVFTALTEDRPYRKPLPPSEVTRILRKMVADGALDEQVVAAVVAQYDELDRRRATAQLSAAWEYKELAAADSGPTA